VYKNAIMHNGAFFFILEEIIQPHKVN